MAHRPRLRLRITCVSDFACPWCALGLRRLDDAVAELEAAGDVVPGSSRERTWVPYPLRRGRRAPDEGVAKRESYVKRLGQDGFDRMVRRLEEEGARSGMRFDFSSAAVLGHTLDAHRLVAWVRDGGGERERLVRELFRAHSELGRNLAERGVLRACAARARLAASPAEIDAFLYADAEAGRVAVEREMARVASEMGFVSGVPHYSFELLDADDTLAREPLRVTAVSGAQDPEYFRLILRRAVERAREAAEERRKKPAML